MRGDSLSMELERIGEMWKRAENGAQRGGAQVQGALQPPPSLFGLLVAYRTISLDVVRGRGGGEVRGRSREG